MRLIKLDRRHHGHSKWTHALQFTKREVHPRYREFAPYVQAFREIYGDDLTWEPGSFIAKHNPNWTWNRKRSRLYLNDVGVLTFIELKLA